MTPDAFRRHLRRLALAWLALLALMLASLASAYVPLGAGNLALGLAIACAKTAIVAALFMELLREHAVIRLVGAVAIGTWLLLIALGGVDYATRGVAPAPFQGAGR